jgi:flagellin
MFRVSPALSTAVINSINRTNALAATAITRLATGLRINRAADDAAGMTVSARLAAIIGALQQANRNAETAVSLTQTADTAAESIGDIVTRLKELAVEAGSTSISSDTRSAIQTEADALLSEIDRIAASTTFNGISVVGAATDITFFVGEGAAGVDDVIGFQTSNLQTSQILGGVTSASIATATAAVNSAVIASLDAGVTNVSLARARVGATQNRLSRSMETVANRVVLLQEAQSAIRDADIAAEASALARAQILAQTGVFALAQTNLASQTVLHLFGLGAR